MPVQIEAAGDVDAGTEGDQKQRARSSRSKRIGNKEQGGLDQKDQAARFFRAQRDGARNQPHTVHAGQTGQEEEEGENKEAAVRRGRACEQGCCRKQNAVYQKMQKSAGQQTAEQQEGERIPALQAHFKDAALHFPLQRTRAVSQSGGAVSPEKITDQKKHDALCGVRLVKGDQAGA